MFLMAGDARNRWIPAGLRRHVAYQLAQRAFAKEESLFRRFKERLDVVAADDGIRLDPLYPDWRAPNHYLWAEELDRLGPSVYKSATVLDMLSQRIGDDSLRKQLGHLLTQAMQRGRDVLARDPAGMHDSSAVLEQLGAEGQGDVDGTPAKEDAGERPGTASGDASGAQLPPYAISSLLQLDAAVQDRMMVTKESRKGKGSKAGKGGEADEAPDRRKIFLREILRLGNVKEYRPFRARQAEAAALLASLPSLCSRVSDACGGLMTHVTLHTSILQMGSWVRLSAPGGLLPVRPQADGARSGD